MNHFEYEAHKEKKFDWGDFWYDHPFVLMVLIIVGIITALLVVYCIRLNTGEKQYTGYIYSAEDNLFQTVGHIRFSENAGADTQPSFCVEKSDGQKIKELAGSGKKVKVTVPAGFRIAPLFVCAFPAKIEEMENE